jgi:hypothetical protein
MVGNPRSPRGGRLVYKQCLVRVKILGGVNCVPVWLILFRVTHLMRGIDGIEKLCDAGNFGLDLQRVGM